MGKIQYHLRAFETKRANLFYCLIVVTSLLISCRGTMAETEAYTTPTQVESFVPQTITPSQMTLPTSDAITPTKLPTYTPLPTRTPYPPTKTPFACPPFSMDTELPAPDIPENYIGLHFDVHELPDGLIWEGYSLIRDYSGQLEYDFTRLNWNDNRQLFWLEEQICYDQQGKVYSEIIDAIASPPLEGNETITSSCFEESKLIPHVIAIGKYDPSQPILEIGEQPDGRPYVGWQYNHIVFAFRIDMERGKFIELDKTDLFCLEYPYGRGSSEP